MNCEEFQKRIMSAPHELDIDTLAHQKKCVTCAKFCKEMHLFDKDLQDALEVPMSPLLDPNFCLSKVRRRQHIAFAVIISLVIILGIIFMANLQPPMHHLVLAHIEHESYALTAQTNPSSAAIRAMLSSLGIEYQADFGSIRFIKRCFIGKYLVAHLVFDGQKGPVTVLIMPNVPLPKHINIKGVQLHGLIHPLGKTSTYAVVGFPGEDLNSMQKLLQVALKIQE